MYTTTGEKMSWKEFDTRRANGEELYIGDYPEEFSREFIAFAHKHTIAETQKWLEEKEATEDCMYINGRPRFYDKWNGECAGVRCTDGYIWN